MGRIFFGIGSRNPVPTAGGLERRNLRLRVRAGPGYDGRGHKLVEVNDGTRPTMIESEHFSGSLVVRVRDYVGVPGDDGVVKQTDNEYFDGTRDTCSIIFGGLFHAHGQEWSVDDVVFGVQFT
jgi:Protein of unknown function (DUF1769)